jgi:hypothetical protein
MGTVALTRPSKEQQSVELLALRRNKACHPDLIYKSATHDSIKKRDQTMASGIKAVTKAEKDNPAIQTEELAFQAGP